MHGNSPPPLPRRFTSFCQTHGTGLLPSSFQVRGGLARGLLVLSRVAHLREPPHRPHRQRRLPRFAQGARASSKQASSKQEARSKQQASSKQAPSKQAASKQQTNSKQTAGKQQAISKQAASNQQTRSSQQTARRATSRMHTVKQEAASRAVPHPCRSALFTVCFILFFFSTPLFPPPPSLHSPFASPCAASLPIALGSTRSRPCAGHAHRPRRLGGEPLTARAC